MSFVCASPAIAIENSPEMLASIVKDATTKIEASHDALLDIKDNATITDADKAEKGVEARKNIISDAILLSLAEIESIRVDFSKIAKLDDKSIENGLLSKFKAELDVYTSYYEERSGNLEKVTTVDEAKAFAKEIIDYRTNIYNPSIEKMAEFILLFYTEETIDTTKTRMTKMLVDINKLEKLNIIKLTLISPKIDKASELLETATNKYLAARELIITAGKAEITDTLPETAPQIEIDAKIESEGLTELETETGIEIPMETKPTAKELIESSLNDIKSTYDIFIQISKDIRRSLGLR